MQFRPKSTKEITESLLLAKGEGKFEITKADEEFSEKCQCAMWHLVMKVWDKDGKQKQVHDYILMNDDFDWKLRHLCESIGIINKYESGIIESEDLVGKSGKLKIGIKVDKTGVYSPQNTALDYIVAKEITKPSDGLNGHITF